ncbi:MAG: S8 family serine peptidase, partial [Chloroflexi bacterium]|nr:S8 family serine peptidase [Chloroflexota bacterium]
ALIWVRSEQNRAVLRTWIAASLYVLLLVPLRFLSITAFQSVAALQIAVMVVFALGLGFWLRRRGGSLPGSSRAGLVLAILLGGILLYPWAWIGALGSPVDSLLALAVGLLFGLSAVMVLQLGVLGSGGDPAEPPSFSGLGLKGLVAALALLIMVTGIGQDGNQWVLVLAIPVLGWAVVALPAVLGGTRPESGGLAVLVVIGLALAGPLMGVDPDELSLIISAGSGELAAWALRAAAIQLALGLVVSIVALVAAKKKAQWGSRLLPLGMVALFVWLGVVVVYAGWGQPGFYGERLFVILKDQADVSAAATISDPIEKRTYVFNTLVEQAQRTQQDLRAQLDRFGITYQAYYLVNGLEVNGGPLLRWWLSRQPEVDRILDNPMLRPLPAAIPPSVGSDSPPGGVLWNQSLIHADQVWQLGVTGKGIVVGQSDSGVQGDHPEVADSYRGQGGQDDYNWFDPWNHTRQPLDIGGHGTHTLGSILGDRVGIAPDATWIGCVNLARNLGNPAYYLDCMQFMLAPFPQDGDPMKDGKPALGAQILNNSWGCPTVEGCDPDTFLPAVTALRAAGIFVVVSTGNSGYSGCGSVSDPPAIYSQVYSVGAVDPLGKLPYFSSLGPVTVDGSLRTKPDIVAPGDGVLSSYPDSSYSVASGTSMAGPHVVGVVALMWSANPNLIGDVDQTVAILNQTAMTYSGTLPPCVDASKKPNDGVGYGLVDAFAAVRMAMQATPSP